MSLSAHSARQRTSSARSVSDAYLSALNVLERLARVVAPLVLRIALALPFLRSAMTRWNGPFSLAPATTFLFEQMFMLHIFGAEYPIPFPNLTAYAVAIAEYLLPSLLILGLATRPAALGLLLMTGVIQLVVPDGWVNFHLYWAALAVAIIALGGGVISLDRLLLSIYRPARRAQRGQS